MRMSKLFALPIEAANYNGLALSRERNAAVEHAVNYHDRLVDTLEALLADSPTLQDYADAYALLREVSHNGA